MKINKKEVLGIIFLGFFMAALGVLLLTFFEQWGIVIFVTILFVSLVVILLELVKRLKDFNQKFSFDTYQNIEGLLSIHNQIHLVHPLNSMRKWAISPDALNMYLKLLKEQDCPLNIVECGSGVSTILSAYVLKEKGSGKVISLDHDEKFGFKTTQELMSHKLSAFAEVVYAPLKKITLGNDTWLMYDYPMNSDFKIDVLFIDGPPEKIQKLSRYPTLPYFYNNLHENSFVVIDDSARKDMLEIINLWLSKYPTLIREDFETEKGTTILRFKK